MRILIVFVLAAALLVPTSTPAFAQEDDGESPFQIQETDQPAGGILIRPNSGRAPENAGDRGGALQLTLLGLIVVFGGVAFYSVRRSSQKALAARTEGA